MAITEQAAKTIAAGEGTHLTVLGDTITVKLAGRDTGGAYALFENINPPEHGIPLHIHRNEDETFYILEGEVELQIGETKITAHAGDTAFLPRDVPHGFRVVGDAPAHMLITASPAGLEDYFAEMSRLGPDGSPDIERVLTISARYGIEFPLPRR